MIHAGLGLIVLTNVIVRAQIQCSSNSSVTKSDFPLCPLSNVPSSFEYDDDAQLRKIVTGQVFQDNVFHSMANCESTVKEMYETFVTERLQPDSKVEIFAPLKKVKVKTCKAANKTRTVKVHDKIVELQSNCNLFARCALIQGKRDIDMKVVVGDYELMAVPRSLMKPDGTLLSEHRGKSDLVTEILKQCGVTVTRTLNLSPDDNTCIVIDAMHTVNTINPKPAWIKTGDCLAKEFCELCRYTFTKCIYNG